MKNIFIRGALLAALGSLAVFGQQNSRRQASITGQGGSPKCTIEVVVDDAADVEIRGTTARLHTLGGREAEWRRFECNQPMPANPVNLHFRGIDGRGRQTLIGDPRNSGVAVVRIEDPKSGSEGYTFDLEWGGSSDPYDRGYGAGFGYPSAPPDRGRDYGRGRDFSSADAVHQCAEAAESQLRRNGYSETRVTNTHFDDEPGHNDWISGSLTGRRGPYQENFSFACPVDLDARQIGSVNVRPANDGYYGREGTRGRGWDAEQAKRACGDAVQQRLQRDGYREVRINGMELDDRPGDNDWIVGGATARRGAFRDNFEFSCSIDFADARVRSINVDRR